MEQVVKKYVVENLTTGWFGAPVVGTPGRFNFYDGTVRGGAAPVPTPAAMFADVHSARHALLMGLQAPNSLVQGDSKAADFGVREIELVLSRAPGWRFLPPNIEQDPMQWALVRWYSGTPHSVLAAHDLPKLTWAKIEATTEDGTMRLSEYDRNPEQMGIRHTSNRVVTFFSSELVSFAPTLLFQAGRDYAHFRKWMQNAREIPVFNFQQIENTPEERTLKLGAVMA